MFYGIDWLFFDSTLTLLDENGAPYPDVIPLLKALSQSPYKAGVIASTPDAQSLLQKAGLMRYFDVVVAPTASGLDARSNAQFSKALLSANCAAENAVMVGADLAQSLSFAKSIGMRTVWVRHTPVPAEEMPCKPDMTISNVSELRGLL